jgi:hemolysin III
MNAMKKVETTIPYSRMEEGLNIATHAIGFLASLIGLYFLMQRAFENGKTIHQLSFAMFGCSLVLLYAASTIYHAAKVPAFRARMRVLDHAAIYVLIAGTYTPFTLVTLSGTVGWTLFGVTWGMAITGVILKLFFTGKYDMMSTIMYVLMGWLIIFAIKPLMNNMSIEGLQWLFAGGAFYTLGAIFYSIRKIPFNHAIFHLFVLAGSFCHYISVYSYVLSS